MISILSDPTQLLVWFIILKFLTPGVDPHPTSLIGALAPLAVAFWGDGFVGLFGHWLAGGWSEKQGFPRVSHFAGGTLSQFFRNSPGYFQRFQGKSDQCELRGLRYVHLRTSSTLKNTDLERDFIYEGDVC